MKRCVHFFMQVKVRGKGFGLKNLLEGLFEHSRDVRLVRQRHHLVDKLVFGLVDVGIRCHMVNYCNLC
jgi:hypothetical protein